MRFYSGNDKIASSLFTWQRIVWEFGHANTDYFGFKDVKETDAGFIVDCGGTKVEVASVHVARGYDPDVTLRVFWFDMP